MKLLHPDWFQWKINDRLLEKSFLDVLDSDGFITSVTLEPKQLPKDVGDLREETESYIKEIVNNCGYKKFAVLLSGIDSEIIVRYLHKLQVDVEIYHIHFWFKPNDDLEIIHKIGSELNIPVNVINFEWYKNRDSMFYIAKNTLQATTVKNTFYYAFQNIPSDCYVFTGCRNFERHSPQYLYHIAKNKHENWNKPGRKTFIDCRQVICRYSLEHLNRNGCGVFWFNNARTTSSMLRDSRTIIEDPNRPGEIDCKLLIKELWSDHTFKHKTDPFVGGKAVYKWEKRWPDHWRNRAKSAVMIQRRYLRMLHGEVKSVCGRVIHDKNDNAWTFGDMLNIDEIL
jgi:hypothetical protein